MSSHPPVSVRALQYPADWVLVMLFAGGRSRKYNEPIVGRTRLMKEMFLLREQARIPPPFYEFEPYKYGPNSRALLEDLESLERRGLVQSSTARGGTSYSLTPDGFRIAAQLYERLDQATKEQVLRIKTRFNSMPLPELLSYVYASYPK